MVQQQVSEALQTLALARDSQTFKSSKTTHPTMKKAENNKCWRGWLAREIETLVHSWWNVKWYSHC